MSSVRGGRYAKFVFCAALAARLLFLAAAHGSIDPLTPDSGDYLALGRHLSGGAGFTIDGENPDHTRAPFYPFMVAAIFELFGESVPAVLFFQALLDAGTAVLVFLLAQSMLGPPFALAAGLLYAFHPVFIAGNAYLVSEPQFFFLFFLSVWLGMDAARRGSWGRYAAAGLVFGLGILSRPSHMYFPPAFLLAFLLMVKPERAALKRAALGWLVFCLCAAAAVKPWSLRNRRVFGAPIMVATGGGSAWWAGSMKFRPIPDFEAGRRYFPDGNFKTLEADAFFMKKAIENWKAGPLGIISEFPYRLRRYWITSHSGVFGIVRTNAQYRSEGRWGILMFKLFLMGLQIATLAGGMAGAWILRRRWREWALHAAAVVYVTLHITNDWGAARYHLTALPFLLILALGGLETWLRDRKKEA